nr:hypothetical protein [Tanacetum cinerariifolium]
LNAKTLNVNYVSAMCDKCVLNDKHGMYVLNSVAKPLKRTVASESNQKPRNVTKNLYERVSKTCSWWYPKFTPSGYNWKPKSHNKNLVEIVLFIVDSGCSKHMIGNLKLLINFVEKFLGTVKFRNDQIAPILGYGDLIQGAVTIKKGYYVEGLNHNLFSVGQFCDADLEVAFRKSTCSCGTDLYSITLQDTNCPNPICLMAKATSSQAWLWHRRLSYLNFDTNNLLSKNDIVVGLLKLKFVKEHLYSSCELGKAKRNSFHTKLTPSLKRWLQLIHMDLCGPMRVASINGKRYVLVIIDDYSRYTWTHFLRSKDKTPEVLINFLRLVQRGLQAQVRIVRTNKGTEFLNQNLHAYFAAEEIHHQQFVARTPEQNGIVEKRNRTLNHSLVIPRHGKTPYHIINDQKPSVKFFHIFGSLCYIVKDGENLDKVKEKGDACIFVGYSTQSKAYRVFNKRTRVIMESIHINFDELPQMASDQVVSKSSIVSSADALNQRQQRTTPLNNHTTHVPTCQVPTLAPTVTSSENMNQAVTYVKNDQVADDEFINIFCTPIQDRGETSSRHALYGLKQAPKAWYDKLSKFLLSKGFSKALVPPMATKHLDASLSGTPVDQTKYRSKVRALMYLTASRPDIMHATCYCAHYQAQPTEKHLTAVKRIFRYLKDTIHMGLWYPKDTGFELTAFSNSDHAGCLDSRKSTSGGIQFLGGDKLVSWSSKKQDCTSMSSSEAEYVSLSACCAQVLWMRT